MTQLSDLSGKSMLDAVDFATTELPSWGDAFETCNVCRFRLNGTVYMAVEDPSDGYRSSMRELAVSKDEMTNVFPAVEVLGFYVTQRPYNQCDILLLIDTMTGRIVLEVGTDNSDDYYPSYVANFQPENMSTNAAAGESGQ